MANATPPEGKASTSCEEWLPLDHYYADRRRSDGKRSKCKRCADVVTMASVAKRADHYLAYQAAWNAKNADRLLAEASARYEANREKRRVQMDAWAEANKERRRQINAESYQRNREAVLERTRAQVAADPEAKRLRGAKRRAMKRAALVGEIDLDALWGDCEGVCYLCVERIDWDVRHPDPMSKSLDHITPLARGGAHSQDNLAWVHLGCNLRKGVNDGRVSQAQRLSGSD